MVEAFPTRLNGRRQFLGQAAAAGALAAFPVPAALADTAINLPLPGGPDARPLTTAFPEKGEMILQRTRPPLLETPFEVFDQGVFTPNDQFYVRWHWSVIPPQVDVTTFRLAVRGHVATAIVAVAGGAAGAAAVRDRRRQPMLGQFARPVPAPRAGRAMGQWRDGQCAMDRRAPADVLDRAGVKAGAVAGALQRPGRHRRCRRGRIS